MKKIAIYGRRFDGRFREQVQQLFNCLDESGIDVIIHKSFNTFLQGQITIHDPQVFTSHEEIKGCDCVFSIGGDGTLLDTIAFVRDSGIPVLGFNTGRLGFLSGTQMDKVDEAVQSLLQGSYSLDKRTLLRLDTNEGLFGNANIALNELTLHKKDSATMMTVHAYINDSFLNTYWADGLIISTPTGSTAYSLSCAGPIMLPESENFVITPIAPHNLNVRPVVIPDNSKVTLKLEGRSDNYLVSLDSRSVFIEEGTVLNISRADYGISLIRLPGQDFMHTLRNKLMWGMDLRN